MKMDMKKFSSDEELHFPEGLRIRILVIDDDPICLKVLERMLTSLHYEVTVSTLPLEALAWLRERKHEFDLVISDVYMPEMDGFKLLELVGLEMDLPVIMISSDGNKDVVMKGIAHGACDYLIKPVTIEQLENIWYHVVRKRNVPKPEHLANKEDIDKLCEPSDEWKGSKRKKEEEAGENGSNSTTSKRPRLVWTQDLHAKFVKAVKKLGMDRAVPKKILELMNDSRLSRENVASHLQKYRMYLKKLDDESRKKSAPIAPILVPSQADFASMPFFDGLDIQGLSVSDQLPVPNHPPLGNPFGSYSSDYTPYFNKLDQMFEDTGLQVGNGELRFMNLSYIDPGSLSHLDAVYGKQISSHAMQMGQQVYEGGIAYNGLAPQPYSEIQVPVNQVTQFQDHGFRFIPTPGAPRQSQDREGSAPSCFSEIHQSLDPIYEACQPVNAILEIPPMDNVLSESIGQNIENEDDNVHGQNALPTDIKTGRQDDFGSDSPTVNEPQVYDGIIVSFTEQQGGEHYFNIKGHNEGNALE